MKMIACVFSCMLIIAGFECTYSSGEERLDTLWKAYQLKFSKKYLISEETVRRVIWEQNVKKILQHNLETDFGLHSYKLEVNKFSDKLEHELDVYRKCASAPGDASSPDIKEYRSDCGKNCLFALAPAVDWRTKGRVTPVKDQENCGSCWAFSSTGSLEALQKEKSGLLVSLSEQNLVDCSWKQGNRGCDGGWMDQAFQYVINNGGIDTESIYPYTGKSGHCKFSRGGVGANCTKYYRVNEGSEIDLQSVVANVGPVSVAIDAGGDDFMTYKSGIYRDDTCSKTMLNHAVLVVGYGSENGSDYWIVKNSWGRDWGMEGYILMARNADNQCGIASHAVFPR